jgi:hypothetical protein
MRAFVSIGLLLLSGVAALACERENERSPERQHHRLAQQEPVQEPEVPLHPVRVHVETRQDAHRAAEHSRDALNDQSLEALRFAARSVAIAAGKDLEMREEATQAIVIEQFERIYAAEREAAESATLANLVAQCVSHAKAGVDLDLVYVATNNRVVFGSKDLDGLKAALGQT